MYKTWYESENRELVGRMIDLLLKSTTSLKELLSNPKYLKENSILKELCDHECVRDEMKLVLNKIYK